MSDERMDFEYRTHEISESNLAQVRSPYPGKRTQFLIIDCVIPVPTIAAEIVLVPEAGGEKGEPPACGRDPPSPLAASPYFAVKFYSTEA